MDLYLIALPIYLLLLIATFYSLKTSIKVQIYNENRLKMQLQMNNKQFLRSGSQQASCWNQKCKIFAYLIKNFTFLYLFVAKNQKRSQPLLLTCSLVSVYIYFQPNWSITIFFGTLISLLIFTVQVINSKNKYQLTTITQENLILLKQQIRKIYVKNVILNSIISIVTLGTYIFLVYLIYKNYFNQKLCFMLQYVGLVTIIDNMAVKPLLFALFSLFGDKIRSIKSYIQHEENTLLIKSTQVINFTSDANLNIENVSEEFNHQTFNYCDQKAIVSYEKNKQTEQTFHNQYNSSKDMKKRYKVQQKMNIKKNNAFFVIESESNEMIACNLQNDIGKKFVEYQEKNNRKKAKIQNFQIDNLFFNNQQYFSQIKQKSIGKSIKKCSSNVFRVQKNQIKNISNINQSDITSTVQNIYDDKQVESKDLSNKKSNIDFEKEKMQYIRNKKYNLNKTCLLKVEQLGLEVGQIKQDRYNKEGQLVNQQTAEAQMINKNQTKVLLKRKRRNTVHIQNDKLEKQKQNIIKIYLPKDDQYNRCKDLQVRKSYKASSTQKSKHKGKRSLGNCRDKPIVHENNFTKQQFYLSQLKI